MYPDLQRELIGTQIFMIVMIETDQRLKMTVDPALGKGFRL